MGMNTVHIVSALLLGFGLAGCGGTSTESSSDAEPIRPAVVRATPLAPAENTRWPLEDRARADVDGDGTREQIRVRTAPGFAPPYVVQVVVEFAGGRTAVTVLDHQPFGTVFSAADIGAGPGEEVFLMRETPARLFTLLSWRGGGLTELGTPDRFPITDDFRDRRVNAFWVRDGVLWGSRSDIRVSFNWDTVEVPETYRVSTWQWRPYAGRTRVISQGHACVHRDRPHDLHAC